MSTTYTDALYSVANLGVVGSAFFSLSSTNNEVVLLSAGTLAGKNVIGIAYNQLDVSFLSGGLNPLSATGLSARGTITLKPYNNGTVSALVSADAPTTLTVGVSSSVGIPLTLLLSDYNTVTITYTSAGTYATDASARSFDVSDKNSRRMKVMGFR